MKRLTTNEKEALYEWSRFDESTNAIREISLGYKGHYKEEEPYRRYKGRVFTESNLDYSHAKDFNSAVAKLPNFTGDIYRGFGLQNAVTMEDWMDKIEIGDIQTFRGHTSFTSDLETAKFFAAKYYKDFKKCPVLFKIKYTKNRDKAVDIDKHTEFAGTEHEVVLLNPEKNYIVKKTGQIDYLYEYHPYLEHSLIYHCAKTKKDKEKYKPTQLFVDIFYAELVAEAI